MTHDDEGREPRPEDADGFPRGPAPAPWLPGSAAGGTTSSPVSSAWRPPTADRSPSPHDTASPSVSIGGASASAPVPPPSAPEAARRGAARPEDAGDPWHIVEAVSEPIGASPAPGAPAPGSARPAVDSATASAAGSPDAPAPAPDASPWPEPGAPVPPAPPLGAAAPDDSRRRNGRIAAAFAVLGGVAVAAIIVATGFAAGWWGPRETTAAAPAVATTAAEDAAAGGGAEPRSDGARPAASSSARPSASASAAAPTVTRASLVSAVYAAPAPAMCQHAAGSFSNGVHHGSNPGGSRAGLHIANPDGSRVNQDGVDRFAATGDLTGDGVPEIAVAAWCEIGGETKPASILVYTPRSSGELELIGAQDLGDLSGTIRAWADTLAISNGVLHVTWDGPWGTTQEKLASVDFTVRGGSLVTSGYQETVRAR